MLSFRKKILISYLIVFLIFISFVFPFASKAVERVVATAMQERAVELIDKIKNAKNNDDLVKRLRQQKFMIFFRVSLITDERKTLYDSHVKRVLGSKFNQEYVAVHPEVEAAFKDGFGYFEDYSMILGGQKFAYMAKAFDFHGKTYVLRTAFPYKYVVEITSDFKWGFIALAATVLLLFTIMTWFIINHLSKPIQKIIDDIKPYQLGHLNVLPEIQLNTSADDEFGQLADTLNSLSSKIQNHIDILTLERNERQAILESLVEGVIAIDPEMTVTYANKMALKLLGINEDIVGKNFIVTNQPKCFAILADCQKEGKVLTDNMQIKKGKGKIYLDIVAAPTNENKGAILVIQDKSEHYKVLEMKKDFIANASHELKTPITVIQGFAETLNEYPDMPKETTVEVTGKIVRNCQRMSSLVKKLLTLADIENLPSSRLVKCDLGDILDHCRTTVLEAYAHANITIEKPENEEINITADRDLIDLALTNLMENAAKYSKPPAQIKVTIETEGSNIKIQVSDSGIGIPEADLEYIFQRFYTVDKAHSRKLGGTGLGLSIVESIIEKHYGKISVASEVGKGTSFTILLPKDTGSHLNK